MRILLVSNHAYPINKWCGSGLKPKRFSSGSAHHIHDLLAKGLAELGHEVFYQLERGTTESLPENVTFVSDHIPPIDIVHGIDPILVANQLPRQYPWVVTCHSGKGYYDLDLMSSTQNWIFVSSTQAESYDKTRFVYNGIDPANYIYSENKKDYFLFISSMNNYLEKGLYTALELSKKMHFELVVAGTSNKNQKIQEVSKLCRKYRAKYIGDVRGDEKSELFANAKAMIFPSKWDECCPLVIAESLISGTPAIVSSNAACAEMMSPDVGFVCADEKDYVDAINNIESISFHQCREYAIRKFHYIRMAKDYLKEYEMEINV